MLKKLIISETHVSITCVTDEINTRPETDELLSLFDATRFYYWQSTPEIAIVSGSSYSTMQTRQQQTSAVLDACAYSYTVDMNTGSYRIAMAISDGQGHSTEEKENVATARIARYNCEQFVDSYEPVSANRYYEINITSRDAFFRYHDRDVPFSYDPFNTPSATLSGAMLVHHADHHDWQLHISGAGDSLTIIIHGETGQVVFSSAARMIERAKGIWSPVGVQQLKENTNLVEVESLRAQEGDWVIQMTDGFWGDLSETTKIEKTDETNLSYTEERLAYLLLDRPIDQIASPSEAAHLVAHTSLNSSIQKRQCYLRLLTDPEYLATRLPTFSSAQEDQSYTMERWIVDNQCSDMLLQKIQAIQALESHDGIHLRGNMNDFPASQRIHYWTSMAFGDCATLQIMRVPNYTECILREWFESDLERWENIAQTTTSSDSHLLDVYIKAVIDQQCIPYQNQGLRWSELNQEKQSPLASLNGLSTQKLVGNLDPTTDFPYVKAIILAGKTPEEKEQRWACFAEFLAAYETDHKRRYHYTFFRKPSNPLTAMRTAVLEHLLDDVRASPPHSAEIKLANALHWPLFTDKEKHRIHQQLTPSICYFH